MTHITRRGLLLGAAAVGAGAAGFLGTKALLGREQTAAAPTAAQPSPAASASPASSPTAAAGASPTQAASASTGQSQPAPIGEPVAVRVISRAGWAARDPQAAMERHTPRRLTLHHTAVLLDDDADSPARIRQHQDYHMDDPAHDYPDLAYHFMVDRRGNVFEGRDLRYRGDTVTNYDPAGHFLVCCEGDYDQQRPTPTQLRSVAALFAWASREYGIPATGKTLAGHRDYADTTCPGKSLEKLIKDGSLARQTAEIAEAPVTLDYLSDGASKTAVARIKAGRPR
jgi:hypothetical protein